MRHVQVLIVGQGLAGTTLAWTLAARGVSYHIVDQELPSTSSRVAAGLVTPVSGQRVVKTWAWEETWFVANRFYSEVGSRMDVPIWRVQPAVRWYETEIQRAKIEPRLTRYHDLVRSYAATEADRENYECPFDGFVLDPAARLETIAYLDHSRIGFQQQGTYTQHHFTNEPIRALTEQLRFPGLDLSAERVVFCQGFTNTPNPWFPGLPLSPSRGDVLTIEVPGLEEHRTLHRGLWMTPRDLKRSDEYKHGREDHLFLVGSTYDWNQLEGNPCEEGRRSILDRLKPWLKPELRVVDHRAAVRPGSIDQKPLMGPSLFDPRVWIFNGLGTKGTLWGPWCAEQLTRSMIDAVPFPRELYWNRRQS